MNRLFAAGVILAAALATGCSSSVDNGPDVRPTDPTSGSLPGSGSAGSGTTPAATAALFQPAQGIFPFPNDLYFAGTTDGTLNIQPANGLIPNQAGLNALDGWSTTAPIRIRFGGALDAASFSAANIRVYQVTVSNTTKAVSGFTRPLTFGTEFSAGLASDTGVGPTILEIRPLVPLQPSAGPATPTSPLPDGTGYLVLLTDGLKMASGAAATADTDYATIKTTLGAGIDPSRCATLPNTPMQGACGFTASHLLVAANPALGALALDPADVVVSFHFSTVATRDTLRVLGLTIFNPQAPAPAIAVAPTAIPLNMINDALPAAASARAGTVTVPYYSYIPTPQAPGGISTDSNVLRTAWRAAAAPPAPLTDPGDERNLTRFNPIPEKRADKAIPLLVIMPNDDAGPAGVKPAAGWPVLIFEHGITRNRTDAFAVAQAFALNGWVIASIDLPLHGITDTASPLYQASNEQTFNLDLVVNASGASGPDGVIDPTGTHFINLPFPLASRDAVRQGAVNLLALTRALPDLDLDGDGEGDVDPARIAFLGHSLGAIVGIDFAAALPLPTDFPAPADFTVNPMRVPTVVLNAPGGGLAELLRDSVTFGPRINAGLQAQGLLPGTSLYAQYFRDVQNIVDAGDPLNYVTQAAARRSIYIQQVVGGGDANSLPDQVIPNSATQRLITAITNNGLAGGLPFPRATPGNNVAGDGYVNFIFGDHGSILNPGTSATTAATTGEMQAEAFLYTAGNPGVPLPPGVIVPGALTTVPVEP